MLALFVVVAIVVVAGIAVLVVRDQPLIADDPVGSRALAWSAQDGVSAQDLAEVRFAVALRGYRMEEVDRVLDDTREALAERDSRIADLQRVVAALGGAPAAAGRVPAAVEGAASGDDASLAGNDVAAGGAASGDDASSADLYVAASPAGAAPADLAPAVATSDGAATPITSAPTAPLASESQP